MSFKFLLSVVASSRVSDCQDRCIEIYRECMIVMCDIADYPFMRFRFHSGKQECMQNTSPIKPAFFDSRYTTCKCANARVVSSWAKRSRRRPNIAGSNIVETQTGSHRTSTLQGLLPLPCQVAQWRNFEEFSHQVTEGFSRLSVYLVPTILVSYKIVLLGLN